MGGGIGDEKGWTILNHKGGQLIPCKNEDMSHSRYISVEDVMIEDGVG